MDVITHPCPHVCSTKLVKGAPVLLLFYYKIESLIMAAILKIVVSWFKFPNNMIPSSVLIIYQHRLDNDLGAVSIRKTVLLGMVIPMLKIRRPSGRLIFNMGIPIPGKTVFYIETGPWRHTGGRPLSQPTTAQYIDAYIQ